MSVNSVNGIQLIPDDYFRKLESSEIFENSEKPLEVDLGCGDGGSGDTSGGGGGATSGAKPKVAYVTNGIASFWVIAEISISWI